MKKFTLAIALLFFIYHSSAQADTSKKIGTVSIENAQVNTAEPTDFDDKVFTRTEIEPSFPGGADSLKSFLAKNLKYPQKTAIKDFQGAVLLQFIVARDGAIQDLEAISGPEEFRQAAIDAMKNSPKWVPARQNGRIVKCYKKLPVYFKP
ncbi:energy transducer TonB [Niastella caeni]|uniref:Energy transducer TonB n=1 Tax=Niastella caeni TaxID=2569763 RepID=A0A4S8HG94_9BACT|nr:energy transducer TonB [Niastella caeni]THU33501.1 energy transducer TonB [Niastella caeni]